MKKASAILLSFILLMAMACQSGKEQVEAPFVHSVYFWFKEGATAAQIAAFKSACEDLRKIDEVKALYYGVPANTTRPIVERSYDFAVVVHFEDLAGHDAYQQHPIHLSLLENHMPIVERAMVTDFE